MAGRAVANRSDAITVSTPRGPVEVIRQQWRSQRAGQATLLAPGSSLDG